MQNANLRLSKGKNKLMRVKTIRLTGFKRFDDLTIDLGSTPKKIVALVGPNGCGKSSIFDGFEQEMKTRRSHGTENDEFYSKSLFYDDNSQDEQYKRPTAKVDFDTGSLKYTTCANCFWILLDEKAP